MFRQVLRANLTLRDLARGVPEARIGAFGFPVPPDPADRAELETPLSGWLAAIRAVPGREPGRRALRTLTGEWLVGIFGPCSRS